MALFLTSQVGVEARALLSSPLDQRQKMNVYINAPRTLCGRPQEWMFQIYRRETKHASPHEYRERLIQAKQLTPSFRAEITGVDISKPVPAEVFPEIHRAITEVGWTIFCCLLSYLHGPLLRWPIVSITYSIPNTALHRQLDSPSQYGALVFCHISLVDARHVAFSALFSELDGVKPYLTLGRKNHLLFDELFDVSSLEDDGSLVEIGSKRHHMSQVCRISSPLEISPFCIRTDTRGACRVIPFSTLIPASTHGRAGFSYPRVHILPPPTRGRNTDFADTRAAFNNLPAKPPTALAKE